MARWWCIQLVYQSVMYENRISQIRKMYGKGISQIRRGGASCGINQRTEIN